MEDFIPKRTKGKHITDVKTKDLYNHYIDNIPKIESLSGGITSGSYDIKEQEYSKILKDINSSIIEIIILENFEFKLPYFLGILSMKQKKVVYKLRRNGDLNTRKLAVDYKALKELWSRDEEARKNKTLVFHTNEHSDGYRISFFWSKMGANTIGIAAYYFMACRKVKRLPAMLLKTSEKKLIFYDKNDIIKKR